MLFIAFVTNPLLVLWGIRKNSFTLFVLRCLKDSGITAFFTQQLGGEHPGEHGAVPQAGAGQGQPPVSIPLGVTINMAGAAVTISHG